MAYRPCYLTQLAAELRLLGVPEPRIAQLVDQTRQQAAAADGPTEETLGPVADYAVELVRRDEAAQRGEEELGLLGRLRTFQPSAWVRAGTYLAVAAVAAWFIIDGILGAATGRESEGLPLWGNILAGVAVTALLILILRGLFDPVRDPKTGRITRWQLRRGRPADGSGDEAAPADEAPKN